MGWLGIMVIISVPIPMQDILCNCPKCDDHWYDLCAQVESNGSWKRRAQVSHLILL